MKEKTYRKMTKKHPLRGFILFKYKYLTKQRFYSLLAKIKLVREVRNNSTDYIRNNDFLNRVRLLESKIETDRGVFNLSYFCRGTIQRYKWWYESLFKHKRLHTVLDEETIYIEAEVRAQCKEFEVRIDPFNHTRVSKQKPHIVVFEHQEPCMLLEALDENATKTVRPKRVCVDFFNARMGTKVTLKADSTDNIEEIVKECVQRATVQMRNYIEGHSAEINERLTGVKFDGEFHTKEGKRLLLNCVCHKCGRPVFESSVEGYTAQCVFCDEDLYSIEVKKIDPVMYEDIYKFNKIPLYRILSE